MRGGPREGNCHSRGLAGFDDRPGAKRARLRYIASSNMAGLASTREGVERQMTERERFHEWARFGAPDRVPYWGMGYWPQTIERWEDEGMPADVHLHAFFGFDRRDGVHLNAGMVPDFRDKTLEETDRYVIRQRSDGVVTKALKTGESHGVRMSMDQHIRFPVEDRASWNEFKKRFNAKSPCRYPLFWEEYKSHLKGRDYPLSIHGGSMFGWPRNWMGFERAATILYDDPALMREIMEFTADFMIELITPALEEIGDIDFGGMWEDMAFKTASIISPKHAREFMLPCYKRVTEVMHKYGIQVIALDSDGYVDELIPIWLEAGINLIYPLEVASGEDPVALRKKYGKDLLIWGGIDKRVLAVDKAAIRREVLSKTPFLIEQGGWIPGIDHSVPPDASFANYMYYLEVVRAVCEGRPVPS
jgi:uroporphyrinogen decarboxylase